jgi:NAD(P)-dependent dehydrogenase (short-subunit alcohol dehydrogenase family)
MTAQHPFAYAGDTALVTGAASGIGGHACRTCGTAPSPSVVNVTSVEACRVVALVDPHSTPHHAAANAGLDMLTKNQDLIA